MAYMLLVVEHPEQRSTRTEEEGRAAYARMVQFSEELKQKGLLTLSQSLKSPSPGSRVKMEGDSTVVTDGPYAETKDLVCGFTIVEAKDLEEAVELTRGCPILAK